MSKPSDSQYLESKVFTASQPRLHQMLLEGAIRFGQQAKQVWNDDESTAEIDQYLNRMMDIVEELTASASTSDNDISKQLVEQYAFLYRELGASRIHRDLQKLDSSLNLLEYHRQTWKLATKQLSSDPSTPVLKTAIAPDHLTPSTSDSFSLEA